MLARIFSFSASIFSWLMVTSIWLSIRPEGVTEATPSVPSSSVRICSLTSRETSWTSIPSTSTAARRTGIILGFSFIIMGLPTPLSFHAASTWSRLSRISTVTESIFALLLNSKITMERFSLEIELISLMLLMVAIACSTGFVTMVSTFSGLAPGKVV